MPALKRILCRVGHVRSRSKYSAEQKRVAVEHYLNHDRFLAGTRKALGYPCRDTLAAWIDEPHPEMRIKVVGKAQSVALPRKDKQAAVIELCTRQAMKRHNNSPPASDQAELERQVESLRRDIRQLQLEHDILKKANELFKLQLP